MSKFQLSLLPTKSGPAGNMATVLDAIMQDETIAWERRMNIRWAFGCFAKAWGCPLREIPAGLRQVSVTLDGITHGMAGVTKETWANARFLIRFALRRRGIIKEPARQQEPFAQKWTRLFKLMDRKFDQIGLTQLARYCTLRGIDPANVDDSVFASWRRWLTDEISIRLPNKVHRRAAIVWNKYAGSTEGWPPQSVSVPDNSRVFFVGWDRFPARLKAEIDNYLASLSSADLSQSERQLKPGSIRARRHQLGAYLSALVLSGVAPEHIGTLKEAVDIERVKTGLEFFRTRAQDGREGQALGIARLLASIAKHRVQVSDDHLEQLKGFCKRLDQSRSMSPRASQRMRQFNDPLNVENLLRLPDMLLDRASKSAGKINHADALLAQTALAIEILLMAAIRRENLAGLNLQKHFHYSRSGECTLIIPAAEVKNGVEIEVTLPRRSSELMERYVSQYRPALCPVADSPWLFPGLLNRPKSRERLAHQIARTIREELGLEMCVQNFRPFAAKFYLDNNPGAYGVVKAVLGHKSIETTIRSYCGHEHRAAIANFDAFVLQKRGPTNGDKRRSPRGSSAR
jgi:integrase